MRFRIYGYMYLSFDSGGVYKMLFNKDQGRIFHVLDTLFAF
jgi:hypothetical protein